MFVPKSHILACVLIRAVRTNRNRKRRKTQESDKESWIVNMPFTKKVTWHCILLLLRCPCSVWLCHWLGSMRNKLGRSSWLKWNSIGSSSWPSQWAFAPCCGQVRIVGLVGYLFAYLRLNAIVLPSPRGSGDSGNSAELPPSQPGVGIPRRGHLGLVSQAAAAAVASGSGTGQASYCSPGLWLGSDRSGLGQSSSLPWTNTRTNSTNHGNQANKKGRANKPQGQLIGDSLEVTYQERLTGFGPHQVSELVELIEARHTQFSALSLCTALHRLATGSLSSLGKVEHRCAGLISTLETQLRLQPDRFRAQSIANACWAVAKLPWAKPLLPVLLETAARRMQQFKGQELSLLLWSMATSESKMQGAVADATNGIVQEFLERGSSAFDAQSTATVAYSAGALLVTHEPLWDAIGTGSASRVSEFSDRQLANLVWGFATVSYADCTVVFERVAKEAPIATLAPIDLSLVAWSLAKVSQGEQDFMIKWQMQLLQNMKPGNIATRGTLRRCCTP